MSLVSGDICPATGSYKEVNEKGKVINHVFVDKGDTMPPTEYASCHYEKED